MRQSVELASGGLQTVLYTAKGQPTYMNIIQKYDMSTIDASLSGTHPAFIVDGVEKPEIFIGTYQGRIVGGELLSLPNVEPTHSTNYTNFLAAARACGNGHHLITNAEWSAVALQCYKDNTQPLGNTYYGRSSEDPLLIGRRADGLNPGDTSGSARTLTGSGPVEWRHNGKENGIADLSGNVWEWNSGMRIFNGEIQVIADNNASKLAIDLGAASTEWKAINGETGNLVTPDGAGTTVGTIKYADGGTADYTINGSNFGGIRNLSTTKPVTAVALARLKALCLYPHIENTASYNSDYFAKNMDGERVPRRGGRWNAAAGAGVFALTLSGVRSSTDTSLGSRPAFVNL
ncbi:formylglycine-generating enzyme family protein [Acinetobacter sp. YH12255]|uniref:formylglycine-generating enzyme family protein n=1 Tax=Acinetobacter sp. YH12255 TaxID=2601179 RepID=UPI00211EB49F|nr:formylglycine-generating enzyme family protein [Acinetobacter sp. YH12255]